MGEAGPAGQTCRDSNRYGGQMEYNDPTFLQEQQHLTGTYEKLTILETELEEQLRTLKDAALEEKKNIREDLTLNFDSDVNAMETYAEFEVMNHVIDGYNIAADARAEKLARVRQLLKAPYFARVCLRYAPDEEEETFYIGSAGLTDEHHDHIVIDWRSPVAETYYSQANGRTSYTVDGRKIEVDLTLRRQFALQRDRLQAYFDTSIAIEDPLLIDSLSRRRTDRMQAITATIQKEQNTVIRHRDVPVLLVNGIAGSGKTSVMLQRIAYLFYQKRDSLKPDQVCLLTLNPVFRKYIENVLPDMGESNPRTLTWPEFMEQTGCPERGRQAFTSADSLRQIDGSLAGFVLQPSDVTGISHGGHTFLSAADVWKAVSKYTRFPAGPRLFSLAEDTLEETLRRRLSKRGKEPDRKERNRIENQFAGPFQKLRSFAWIRTDQIGRRLLGRDRLTAAQSLYLKMALTGMEDKYTRYVMVDEVQDYTEAQLMVLSRYYRTARFMMLGDENQAIVPDRVAFSAMNDIFGRDHGRVLTCDLMTSYRSSPEITELFASLLTERDRIRISSVRRPGIEPVMEVLPSGKALVGRLAEWIGRAEEEEGLTAVLTSSVSGLERLAARLGDRSPAVIRRGDALPERGVIAMDLSLAKGLEFDTVILADADPDVYREDRIGRNRLYTAISRAAARVIILAEKELTPLLTGRPGDAGWKKQRLSEESRR